ncbi:hypothetical protein D3C86_1515920 [compost metagenome]
MRADGAHQQGVAVRGGFGDDVRADIAARAGFVVDHHVPAWQLGQFGGHGPREDVGGAAGREGHHEADRLVRVRIGGKRGGRGQGEGSQGGGQQQRKGAPAGVVHEGSPVGGRLSGLPVSGPF